MGHGQKCVRKKEMHEFVTAILIASVSRIDKIIGLFCKRAL